jgi:hypothetical protein
MRLKETIEDEQQADKHDDDASGLDQIGVIGEFKGDVGILFDQIPCKRDSLWCRLRLGFPILVAAFCFKKIDLDRKLIVPQPFEFSFCGQTFLDPLLDVRFGLSINIQLALEN